MKKSLLLLLVTASLFGACSPSDRDETIGSVRLAYDEEPPEPPDAIVLWHDLPETMACNEERTVHVRLRNTATPIWHVGTYKLGAATIGHFSGPSRVDLPEDIEVNQDVELAFQLRAPGFETDESVGYQMIRQPSAWFGDIAERTIHVRCDGGGGSGGGGGGGGAAFDAQIVSASMPTNVECGQTFNVAVTMRNTGSEDWLPQEGVALGAVGEDDPFAQTTRVPIQNTVPHNGGVYAFLMTFRAPAGPGSYDTDWRMVRDGGGPWFGQTFTRTIDVSCEPLVDNAEVSWDLNPTVACSDHPTVHVHVHNTGTTTWRSYTTQHGYTLALAPGSLPLAEQFHAFPPNVDVPPDGHYTFSVAFAAPPLPGQYPFGLEMYNQDRHAYFGQIVQANLNPACNPDDAVVANETLATEVGCGRPYPVHIRMRNTGLDTWTREARYALGNSYGSLAFLPATTRVELPPNVSSVPRGSEVDFDFLLTAPFQPSPFHLQSWRMVHGADTAFFGNGVSKTVNVHCDQNVADLVDFDLPESLGCGDGSRASVTLRNMGSAAWNDRLGYELVAVDGNSPFATPGVRLPIDVTVLPGQGHKFEFDLVAPFGPTGAHAAFQLEQAGTRFGPIIERDVSIQCPLLGARLVTAVMSNRDSCDPEVEMQVTMRNMGLRAWGVDAGGADTGTGPDHFSLNEIGGPSPFALVHDVPLAADVKVRPGETHTFLVRLLRRQDRTFSVEATWWQMLITPAGPVNLRNGPRYFGKGARVRVPPACRREPESLAPSLEYEAPK